jgi:hypothetical protein
MVNPHNFIDADPPQRILLSMELPMQSAAAYVTHTLLGPIPHFRVESPFGPIYAPVKLIVEKGRVVTSFYGLKRQPTGFPVIHDHHFIHALPSGQEIKGNPIGYFEEQRFNKLREDLLTHWRKSSHKEEADA